MRIARRFVTCFDVQKDDSYKLEFHDADTDTDTDILARIFADTSDARDFLKLFLWQAERHADILATILPRISARMSVSVSMSASWNASLYLTTGNDDAGAGGL